MKRMKSYIVSCLTLTLLVGCNAAEKPVETVKQVKNTIETKLTTDEKMVEIDGQTIYFKQIGKKKPALLMLHGFGGSSNGFSDIYADLAKDHTIISVDVLGFGHSSKPMDFPYSFPNHANLYYKLMKKLGYDTFAVLGHSMGGEISLNLTYLYPNAVTHLILTDATGAVSLTNRNASPKPQLSTDLNTVSSITNYDESKVKFKRDDTEHYNQMKMWPRRLKINASEIKLPTLIIWGRNDSSVSWKEGESYHQFLKNSAFHIIEKGYHAPFRQEPKEFMGYVKEFFEKNPTETTK
ncbi:alpha/beta hydrolase [Bacillus pseudomycoides]|nr:alpha/beta hydrolase [Bacillus pseudomycoides]PEF75080.1 alpha/beta hydrolase [Bacillus pseudomycoides]PEI49169.1 alpha/beta hydrolase [Bacillus pseudomycoides]PEL88049.1 alpha/beta hydrolase [Bacillus pseudomycoides]PGA74882.1 alpha/beta hydrolase [Bacillus pseudomycoides]PHB29019.1 alpha/beta hydrolase [Bacillus pseudomycoides]